MRSFVAIVPPTNVVRDLERFLEPRVEAAPEWRWTPMENAHITLAFLGDVDDRHLDRLLEALADVASRTPPLRVRLDGAGGFPHLAATRHLYQVVSDVDGGLAQLAERVRTGASHAGCPVDADRFTAHVTVARTASKRDATHLWRALDTYRSEAWTVAEFALMRSHLGEGRNGAPRYTVYETFALGADAERPLRP